MFEIEQNGEHYISKSLWTPFPTFPVFGGQILAQSLQCAIRQSKKGFEVHSCHIYFLSPGEKNTPISFKVKTLREGHSFACYSVRAIQNENLISSTEISFTKTFYDDCNFQSENITVYKDNFKALEDEVKSRFETHRNSFGENYEKLLNLTLNHLSYVENFVIIEFGRTNSNKRQLRFTLKNKDYCSTYRTCIVAFLSDFLLLEPALHVSNVDLFSGKVKKIASINHTLHFHNKIDTDVLIYTVECIRVCGDRAYCLGTLTDESGKLLASATQEGLVRFRENKDMEQKL